MSYTIDRKSGEITISGFEKGIAPSPHEGLANIQNANIATETGEVLNSFARIQQSQVAITGTLTQIATDAVSVTVNTGNGFLQTGTWVQINSTGISGLNNGQSYYVLDGSSLSVGYELSVTYSTTNATKISGLGSGSCTFQTINMSKPVSSAMESYVDLANVQQNRYYIQDATGFVWVHDTSTAQYTNISFPPVWFLPQNSSVSPSTGLEILNGWLFTSSTNGALQAKPTSDLGRSFNTVTNFLSPLGNPNPHTLFTGHQGDLYWCDGCFIGSLFPNTSLLTGINNVQSYCSYTTVTDNFTGLLTILISGSFFVTSTRIPTYFFTDIHGTLPSALTEGTTYYMDTSLTAKEFKVYVAASGGSALDISTGATGKQYFNTFYPLVGGGGNTTMTLTQQRLNLPTFEIAQSIIEIGNTIIIGTQGNVLYPWNQIDPTPSDLIFLPESNVVNMICVNNMAYVFAGNKGNIYITNGSTASPAISVPDYCAGIAGTPASYIEPYFSWGDAMYLRGRVYFSILDQTSTKTGNCGGIWSFIPTQNFFIGQDVGLALRLENRNSYGTYNGVATVLIPAQNQVAQSPQYWSAWYSNITSPLFGIDFTDTAVRTTSPTVIETDLIPTGTMLDKKTFEQIEFKVTTPIVDSGTVAISYRTDSTSAYTSLGNLAITETNPLSGYFTANFEKTQWLQLKVTLTPNPATIRLTEIIIR